MSARQLHSSHSLQNLIDPGVSGYYEPGQSKRLNNLSLSPIKNKESLRFSSSTTTHNISRSPERQSNGIHRFQYSTERSSSNTSRYLRMSTNEPGRQNFGSQDRPNIKFPPLRTRVSDDPEAIKTLLNIKKPHRRGRVHAHYQRSSPSIRNNIQENVHNNYNHHLYQHQQLQQHYMHQKYQDLLVRSQQQSMMNQLLLKAIERVRTLPNEDTSDDEEDAFMENQKMIRALDKQSAVLQRIALEFKQDSESRARQEALLLMHKIDKAEIKNHLHKGQKIINKVATLGPSDPLDPEALQASEEVSEDEDNEKERLQQLYDQIKLEQSKIKETNHELQEKRPRSRINLRTPAKEQLRTETDMTETFQSEGFPVPYNLCPQIGWHQTPMPQMVMPQQSFQLSGMYGFSQPDLSYQQLPYQTPNYSNSSLLPQFNHQKTQQLPGLSQIRFPDWNGTHQFPSLEQQYLYNPSNVRIIYRDANEEKKAKEDDHSQNQETHGKKKRKKYGKVVLKKKLKTYLWLICYTSLLKREAKKKVATRKQNIQLSATSTLQSAFASAQAFILKSCSKALDEIYKEKKVMILTGDEKGLFGSKSVSEKDADTRIKELIFPKLHMLLTGLIASTKAEIFPNDLALFLATISEDQCVPLNNFYLNMELDRLSFSQFGTLKGMTEAHSKMVIAVFMVVRVLVYQFLLEPWSQLSSLKLNIPKSDTIRKGFKTLGSILTIFLEDFIKISVMLQNGNQNHLSPEVKIQPFSYGAILYSDKENEKIVPKSMINDRTIAGIYTKDELAYFFRNKKQEAEQLNSLFVAWIGALHTLSHQAYVEKKQLIMSNGNS